MFLLINLRKLIYKPYTCLIPPGLFSSTDETDAKELEDLFKEYMGISSSTRPRLDPGRLQQTLFTQPAQHTLTSF